MAKYEERSEAPNAPAPNTVVQKPSNPDAFAGIVDADQVDINAFVRELIISDKVILDYLKESEAKSGG